MRTLDRFSALLSVRGDMSLKSIDMGAQSDVLGDVEGSTRLSGSSDATINGESRG